MSKRNDVAVEQISAGQDVELVYEIFDSTGVTMQDVAGWTFVWYLRRIKIGKDPFTEPGAIVLQKASPAIVIDGTWNAARASNTQRVRVSIADTETESLMGAVYVDSLWRADNGQEVPVSHGLVPLMKV